MARPPSAGPATYPPTGASRPSALTSPPGQPPRGPSGPASAEPVRCHFGPEVVEPRARRKHGGTGPVPGQRIEVSPLAAAESIETMGRAVTEAKNEGRRIVAVGTTSTRALEAAAVRTGAGWRLQATRGATSLFITPGYEFRIVDALITNFHLPRSTLLALVGALAGLDRMVCAHYSLVLLRRQDNEGGDKRNRTTVNQSMPKAMSFSGGD